MSFNKVLKRFSNILRGLGRGIQIFCFLHFCDVAEVAIIHKTVQPNFFCYKWDLKEMKLRHLSHFCYMLKPTREIWKFLKENLVTRKPEKHKFLTILKKKNWLKFCQRKYQAYQREDLIQGFSCLNIKKQIFYQEAMTEHHLLSPYNWICGIFSKFVMVNSNDKN